jgi:TolB-like protein/Tfp pilus assembly protein PilF
VPTELPSDLKFEIGHVLFIDIVGYSKLLISEQSAQIQMLKEIVRGTEQFRLAEAEGKLHRLPTGDGGALVFRNSPEAPVLCALEISKELKNHPELHVRMGIHSGPVNEVSDLNEQANISGAGVNTAQRVMDCGDAGHILLSKRVTDDLDQYPQWRPQLHDLGEVEVKHGVRLGIVNFWGDHFGNPALPEKIVARRQEQATASQVEEKRSRRKRRMVAVTFLTITAAAIVVSIIAYKMSRQLRQEHLERKAASLIPEKSIAVLPFENRSEDKANAYFADGIQDEILTRLSKIADLKVISRTSTQHYKSAPENLREIAKQLGVATIVEGSVQKSGDAVRVNVQLIKAANDSHLWADTFDRKLSDIFSVESEIAKTIGEQLQAKLSGLEQKALADKPTQNTAAYDAYLRGLAIEHNQYGFGAEAGAAEAYSEAVRLDPTFALAWANLAIARSPLYLYGIDATTNSAAAVRDAADRAMALQPDLAEAWAAQGAYRYRVGRDFSGARQAYEEAHKRLPNSSRVLLEMAVVETRLGRWDAAEAHYRKAMELDPRSSSLLAAVAREFLARLRRFSEAQVLLDKVLEISPNDQWAHTDKAWMFLAEGRLDEAAKELAHSPADSMADNVVATRADLAAWEREFDAVIALIQGKLNSIAPEQSLDEWTKILIVRLGYCQEWAGRPLEAKATFNRAIQEIRPPNNALLAPKGFGMSIYLALAYAGLGEKEKALEQARRAVQEYADDSWVKADAEGALAQIQARFGDVDSAIAVLPHLLEVPAGITPADLRFNPLWDPLRGNPRFQKLCEEKQK